MPWTRVSFSDVLIGETFKLTQSDTDTSWKKRSSRTALLAESLTIWYFFVSGQTCYVRRAVETEYETAKAQHGEQCSADCPDQCEFR